jgi:hypothetical protein
LPTLIAQQFFRPRIEIEPDELDALAGEDISVRAPR